MVSFDDLILFHVSTTESQILSTVIETSFDSIFFAFMILESSFCIRVPRRTDKSFIVSNNLSWEVVPNL